MVRGGRRSNYPREVIILNSLVNGGRLFKEGN